MRKKTAVGRSFFVVRACGERADRGVRPYNPSVGADAYIGPPRRAP